MRVFIEAQIKLAAESVAIIHVDEKTTTPSNLTMPKPRVDYEFLPDSIIPTGRKIALRREDDTRIIVYERYEVDTPVMLYITHDNDAELEQLSTALIMAFPKGVADTENNWVRIRASVAEWSKSGASKAGLVKIEPIKERVRTIRIGFMWRMTYETYARYFKQEDIKFIPKIGDHNEQKD